MYKEQILKCKICNLTIEELLWDLLELGKLRQQHDKICAYICEGCFYKELTKPLMEQKQCEQICGDEKHFTKHRIKKTIICQQNKLYEVKKNDQDNSQNYICQNEFDDQILEYQELIAYIKHNHPDQKNQLNDLKNTKKIKLEKKIIKSIAQTKKEGVRYLDLNNIFSVQNLPQRNKLEKNINYDNATIASASGYDKQIGYRKGIDLLLRKYNYKQ